MWKVMKGEYVSRIRSLQEQTVQAVPSHPDPQGRYRLPSQTVLDHSVHRCLPRFDSERPSVSRTLKKEFKRLTEDKGVS